MGDGRVRVETLTGCPSSPGREATAARPERWTLQTNMEGQP